METELKIKHLVALVALYLAYTVMTDHWVVQNMVQYLSMLQRG